MSVLDKFRLNNKVAIITGAAQGLGKSIAKGMAEAGARIVRLTIHRLSLLIMLLKPGLFI